MKLLIMQFSQASCLLLGVNLLSAPWSQYHTVYVLPLVWKNKFHTHIKQVKPILCIFIFLDRAQEDKNILNWMVASIPHISSVLISLQMHFQFVTVFPTILTFPHFWKDFSDKT
jgi:hypothetical protein